jgi:hypothetical protein
MKRNKPNYNEVNRIKPDRVTVDRTPLTEEQKEELKRKEKKKKDHKIIKWLSGITFVSIILVIIDSARRAKREFTDKDQVEEWLLELDYPEDEIADYMENGYDPNISLEEYAIGIENSTSMDDLFNKTTLP